MKKKGFKTTIGGQALIEGVMMKGPSKTSYAVRKPDGEIELKIKENHSLDEKYRILRLPILRGAFKLVEAMVVGTEALTYSASFWEEEPEEIKSERRSKIEDGITILFSFVLAIFLFMVLPSVVTSLGKEFIQNTVGLNLIEGILRLVVFFIYLFVISKNKDIYRVFQYHGAEHKSIACYEDGCDLTVENVKKYSRMHPRCGTSFIFMVLLLSILFLSFFGWPNFVARILIRILSFPVIAGISYELNRVVGRYDNPITALLRWPGLMIQKIATVKEPDEQQIEVGIASLVAVLPAEGENDLWK